MSLVDLHIYGKIGEEGGVEVEPLTVTENGTYTAEEGKAYTPVTVNVPQPSGSISITENGTYDVADKASAVVNVSGGGGDTPSISFVFTPGSTAQKIEEMRLTGFETIPESLFENSGFANRAKKLIIGDGTVVIGSKAFSGVVNSSSAYTKTEEIILPNSVTTINPGAFRNFPNVTSLTLPSSLTGIYNSALYSVGMTSLDFPASLKETAMNTIRECANLTTVRFHGKPRTLNESTFYGCTALADIYVPWAENEVAGAPWGATNATIHYNWTPTV